MEENKQKTAQIVYEAQLGPNHVLIIDEDKPHPLVQFKIGETVFDSVVVHDVERAIAFKGSGTFLGETVEFLEWRPRSSNHKLTAADS